MTDAGEPRSELLEGDVGAQPFAVAILAENGETAGESGGFGFDELATEKSESDVVGEGDGRRLDVADVHDRDAGMQVLDLGVEEWQTIEIDGLEFG
jgi:hypothetical protein